MTLPYVVCFDETVELEKGKLLPAKSAVLCPQTEHVQWETGDDVNGKIRCLHIVVNDVFEIRLDACVNNAMLAFSKVIGCTWSKCTGKS